MDSYVSMDKQPKRKFRITALATAAASIVLVMVVYASQGPSLSSAVSSVGMRSAIRPSRVAVCSKVSKVDLNKSGTTSIGDESIKANLQGYSRAMKDKNWVDPQGRKGRGLGVYRFADKYGANVDGYSPIYTPDIWADSGNAYKLGGNAIAAWYPMRCLFFRCFDDN